LLDFFNGEKGTVNSFNVVTDANGKAEFTYTAPADLSDLNGTILTFKMDNYRSKEVNATLLVSAATIQKPKIRVDAADSSITVSEDGESVTVRILAFDGNNQALDTGSILVRYPDEIVDNNVSGGYFIQREVPIANGEALFTYNGPDPLINIGSLNFDFIYKEDSTVTTVLTVKYLPHVATVLLDETQRTVTLNKEVININAQVINEDNVPYPDGNVTIAYPNDVREGRDIGSFANSTVAVVNGEASFVYTAPANLDENTSDMIFRFYHSSDPSGGAELNISIRPEANQTIFTNYSLNSSLSDGTVTMDLNSSKLMSFYVEDANGNLVSDDNMTEMNISVLNPNLATIEDTLGHKGTAIGIEDSNNVSVNAKSKTITGIVPIKVDARFYDVNNNEQNLSRVFNVVVLSGPPSAMSLSYAGTVQDSEHAKFVENWVLTVTDKYNNLVNTNPAVSMGMLAGYAQTGTDTSNNIANYLYFDPANGADINGTTDEINASKNVFANVDPTREYLVTFGNGYVYDASGKWDVQTTGDDKILSLVDDYNGSDVSGLGFAVGNNYRADRCAGGEWVGNVYPKDNNYILGDTGSMILQVSYDYYLVGKSVMLWANLVGSNGNNIKRVGESKKISLRGNGLEAEEYNFSKGFEGVVRLNVSVKDTVEYYYNANFGYHVEVNADDANWTVIGDSMRDGNITDCSLNSGVGYVDINFTSPSGSAGTVKLTNVLTKHEF
jgi:hypothetical protein